MKKNNEIVKKTSLIEKVKKSVFIWVALASCVVAASIMILIVLFRIGMFNAKVSGELNKTKDQLNENKMAVKELKSTLKQLNTDKNLGSIKSSEEAEPIQTILDALPTEDNRLALGSSVQEKFLAGIDGIKVESINLSDSDTSSDSAASTNGEFGMQNVSLSLSGDPDKIQDLLKRFERSIRAVDIISIGATASETGQLNVQINASLPYLSPIDVQLKTKKITDE